MSLYLKTENQELLWKTIHKTPLIDNYFREPGSREIWFQNVVKMFHIRNPSVLNQEMLARINRDTIAYMVSFLKAPKPALTSSPPVINEKPLSIGQTELREPTTIYSRTGPIKDEFAEKFASRQKDYESMLQKPVVPEIKFSEKIEDGVIQNMDELVQQQIKQRELDMSNFGPLPSTIGAPTSSRKLSIGEDLGSHIESIPLNGDMALLDSNRALSFKKVTFEDKSEKDIEKEGGLELRVRELESKIRELEVLFRDSQIKIEDKGSQIKIEDKDT
jgi:hypothetical protein